VHTNKWILKRHTNHETRDTNLEDQNVRRYRFGRILSIRHGTAHKTRCLMPFNWGTATHCNTLQHTATHCNTCLSMGEMANRNTLQHAATHRNTHTTHAFQWGKWQAGRTGAKWRQHVIYDTFWVLEWHTLLYWRCRRTDYSYGSCGLESCSHTPTTHMAPPRIIARGWPDVEGTVRPLRGVTYVTFGVTFVTFGVTFVTFWWDLETC